MNTLTNEKIKLSKKGDPTLSEKNVNELLLEIPEWILINDDGVDKLQREYRFKDYLVILDLCHKIGMIADQVNHHPVLHLEWGELTVTWWTHVIGGLHKNDFIMAAKCERAAMLVTAP